MANSLTDGRPAKTRADRLQRVRELLPAISRLDDETLEAAVEEIWLEAWDESAWADLAEVPKGVYGGKPSSRSLIEHVCAVTDGACAFAETMRAVHGWAYDRNLLLTAALLHDASKVVESEPGPDGVVVSDLGRLVQHGIWTAHRIMNRGMGLELTHLIVSHTPASRSKPLTVEGVILYYIDMLDSDILSWHSQQPLHLTK